VRFALYDHAGKSAYLRQALYAHGHTESDRIEDTDLLLLDTDAPWAHPRPEMIAAAKAAGAKVALYPHGGQPACWMYDGICDPDPGVDMRLEHGPGSLEIAQLIGVDLRQNATGWLYSPTHPFKPVENPRTVLFAPLHPIIEGLGKQMNGHDPAPAWNQRVYRDLLALGYDLAVSVVGPLQRSGIWQHPRALIVTNPQMLFTHSYEQIMAADVVVAAGTMAVAAVACGKPVVMLGQDNFQDYVDGEYPQAARPDLYRNLIRYPLDTSEGDLDDLIAQACGGDQAADEWRERFVGDDGTDTAITLLEQLIDSAAAAAPLESRSVTVEGATATAIGVGGG
jgi:hypothetical protein